MNLFIHREYIVWDLPTEKLAPHLHLNKIAVIELRKEDYNHLHFSIDIFKVWTLLSSAVITSMYYKTELFVGIQ